MTVRTEPGGRCSYMKDRDLFGQRGNSVTKGEGVTRFRTEHIETNQLTTINNLDV